MKHVNNIYLDNKAIMAIDYGTKVTGLAKIVVAREPFPYPLGKIVRTNDKQVIDDILKHVEDEFIDIIVLGIPHLLDGQETTMTRTIKAFGEELKKKTSIPVYYHDETLSTYAAQDRMKNSPRYNFKVDPKHIDEVAATIILEEFLEKNKSLKNI